MISAASTSSTYTPVPRVAKAAAIQVEAVIATEKSIQISRDVAAAKAIEDARQKFLQTQYVGPARATARLTTLGNERPQDQHGQYTGPARAAARLEALGIDLTGVKNLQSNYQDLRSGCHAGPKPVSIITAEEQYRQILDITV